MKEKVVILVDAYSTGTYLAPHLKKIGITALHIQSSENLPPYFLKSHVAKNYVKCIVNTSLNNTLRQINKYDVLDVIPGSDPGVRLADKISNALKINENNPSLAEARQDKYVMIQTLADVGLSSIRQIYTNSLNELVIWASALPKHFVVKPRNSTGVNGVFLCHSIEELISAFHKSLKSKTVYGKNEPKVLVQTLLKGSEFIVNSVSHNKKVHIFEVWRVKRDKTKTPILRTMDLLQLSDVDYRIILYAKKILDNLGLYNGPCHMEIMMTKNGPELIEINARMHGDMDPTAPLRINKTNHIIETCRHLENQNPSIISDSFSSGFCMKISLRIHKCGEVSKEVPWHELEKLDSFHSLRKRIQKGQKVKTTFSVGSSAGSLFLVSQSQQSILRDYRKVLRWEKITLNSIIL